MQGGVLAKWGLWIEWLGIFVVTPVLFWLDIIYTPTILLPLILISLLCAVWLGRKHGVNSSAFWYGELQAEKRQLPVVLFRFVLLSLLFAVVVWLEAPQQLFWLPLNSPLLWLLLLIGYPLLSVYPQELLFRAYYFRRYQRILGDRSMIVATNAVAFSWMHVVFDNYVAVVLSLLGGYLFARSYQLTGSLRLVCLEHALYGCLIFTLGAGHLFFFEAGWINP